MAHAPGDPCGPCELDLWACDGAVSMTCDGVKACVEPPATVTDLTASDETDTEVVRLTCTAVEGATGIALAWNAALAAPGDVGGCMVRAVNDAVAGTPVCG